MELIRRPPRQLDGRGRARKASMAPLTRLALTPRRIGSWPGASLESSEVQAGVLILKVAGAGQRSHQFPHFDGETDRRSQGKTFLLPSLKRPPSAKPARALVEGGGPPSN